MGVVCVPLLARNLWVNGLLVMINRYKRHTQGDLIELLDDDLRFPTTEGDLGMFDADFLCFLLCIVMSKNTPMNIDRQSVRVV